MIKLYSSHCPQCMVVENTMKQKKIEYEVIDDAEKYMPIANENGIMSMPFADVDGKIMNGKELFNTVKNM